MAYLRQPYLDILIGRDNREIKARIVAGVHLGGRKHGLQVDDEPLSWIVAEGKLEIKICLRDGLRYGIVELLYQRLVLALMFQPESVDASRLMELLQQGDDSQRMA